MSLVPFLSLASFAAAGRPRPNILFSMADQLRFDALSSVTPSLHTPALLAKLPPVRAKAPHHTIVPSSTV